jgi:membrane protein
VKRVKSFFSVTKKIITSFLDDACLNVAAAITYYILQSIIPLVLGVIVVASFVLQQNQSARDDFIKAVKDALPSSGIDMGKIINDMTGSAPGLLSVTGVLLLWSGSSIFEALIYGINIAYGVRKDKRNFFVKIGLRFGLLFLVGAVIAAVYAVIILSELIFSAKIELFGISPSNFSFIRPLISYLLPVALMFGVFAILYKLGPNRKGVKWRGVLVGALVGAILFELLTYGFNFYVTSFNAADSYAKTYGALGGILLLLFYLWLLAAVMLLGAEVAAVLGGWKEAPPAGTKPDANGNESETASLATSSEPELALQSASVSGESTRALNVFPPAGPRSSKNLLIGSVVVGLGMLLSIFIKPKEPKI